MQREPLFTNVTILITIKPILIIRQDSWNAIRTPLYAPIRHDKTVPPSGYFFALGILYPLRRDITTRFAARRDSSSVTMQMFEQPVISRDHRSTTSFLRETRLFISSSSSLFSILTSSFIRRKFVTDESSRES